MCRRTKEGSEIPEVHVDYMFMGEESGGGTMAVLVVKERQTKALMASVVPTKSSGEFVAKRVVAFMRDFGVDKVEATMRTDNEPALVAVAEDVARYRAAGGGRRG